MDTSELEPIAPDVIAIIRNHIMAGVYSHRILSLLIEPDTDFQNKPVITATIRACYCDQNTSFIDLMLHISAAMREIAAKGEVRPVYFRIKHDT